MSYLVLIRHGESTWNKKGLWTGLTDINLDEEGRRKSGKAGEAIKDIDFQIAYTSKLKRAQETLKEVKSQLENSDFPILEDAALNERDYGDLTAKNKWKIRKEYGWKQFMKWRRSWDFPVPKGETLKDVYQRTVPFYQKHILPDLKERKNVLVVAHGNSLRALVKYLENISDKEIPYLEIATGEVDIYQMDQDGKIIAKEIKNVSWLQKIQMLMGRLIEKFMI